MEPRINSQSDNENGGIDKRLDKLAEDIKKLPQSRIETLERIIHALVIREEEKDKKPPTAEKKTFSLKETATILGVSKDTIRRAITMGTLRAVQFKKHGTWYVPIEEVERFLKGGE